MIRWPFLFETLLLCSAATLQAQTAPPAASLERRVLCSRESAGQWAAAESTIDSSTAHTKTASQSLHWHITVDYFGGEAKYPIGWPRVHWAISDPAARNWSQWDFLNLRVYTDTSRETLPSEPVGLTLYTPDKAGAYNRPLVELMKGQWVDIRIPLAQVPRPQDVRLMQLHISESKYRHEDRLDLYFDEIALLRYAEPTLVDFAPESAVMFSDARYIPVRLQLLGVKPDSHTRITCDLSRDGRVAAQAVATATRGVQRVVLDVGREPLTPGMYELTARLPGAEHSARSQVRIIESPWK